MGLKTFGRWNTTMQFGAVKWFYATKGFGFIQLDAGGLDAFVQISAVQLRPRLAP